MSRPAERQPPGGVPEVTPGSIVHCRNCDRVLLDLPWNPNRLEQREGRVDRYGQTAPLVKAMRYFSPDSAVDGVVLDVLLNKAREIHRARGTHVPVPEESESVTEAVLHALFLRGGKTDARQIQLDFGFEAPQVASLHARWERDAERERINRTRFGVSI